MKKLALAFVLVLTACASPPEVIPLPKQLDYSGLGRLELAAQDVRVVNRAYALPQTPPYIGHLFRPTLAEAVDRWASDRLQANGAAGHVVVVIKDASLTESKISNVDKGIESWFTREQGKKYTGRIEVSVEAQGGANGAMAYASANAVHSVTVSEEPTAVEKYDAYKKLLAALMQDLNANLEQAMRDHLGTYLLTPVTMDGGNALPMNAAPQVPVAEVPMEVMPASGRPMPLKAR